MGGRQADDDAWVYHADIGYTYDLPIGPGGAQLTDAQGPLSPGRWLVQLRTTFTAQWAWVILGPFEKGSPIALTAGAGRQRIPLSRASVIAAEFHVRKGYNDRIGGITESDTANLLITQVSRKGRT